MCYCVKQHCGDPNHKNINNSNISMTFKLQVAQYNIQLQIEYSYVNQDAICCLLFQYKNMGFRNGVSEMTIAGCGPQII